MAASPDVLLNGVPIGRWDEAGRWVRYPKAAPYFPRPEMKRQQKLSLDWGSANPRPMRNLDKQPLRMRPISPALPVRS